MSHSNSVKQHGQRDSCGECAWVALDRRKTKSELGLQPSAHSRIWKSVMCFGHMEEKKYSSAINKNNRMCLFLSSTHHQTALPGSKCKHRSWYSQQKRQSQTSLLLFTDLKNAPASLEQNFIAVPLHVLFSSSFVKTLKRKRQKNPPPKPQKTLQNSYSL